MKLIEEKELAQLIKDSYRLGCLEDAGVDNWEGYDYAFDPDFSDTAKEYRKLRNKSYEEIVKDYKDA